MTREWVKDCECPGPSSSGQIWNTCEPNGDTVVLTAHFEPRIACEKCQRPWRLVGGSDA